jgi:hypothetical protein
MTQQHARPETARDDALAFVVVRGFSLVVVGGFSVRRGTRL